VSCHCFIGLQAVMLAPVTLALSERSTIPSAPEARAGQDRT